MESRPTLIHTAEMGAARLAAARALLDLAFGETFTDQDWEHALGGMDAIERGVRDAYELGALSATEDAARFYERRGWQRWRGVTSALTPTGIARTPEEDGGIFVFPVSADLDLYGELTCDWRDGDVW